MSSIKLFDSTNLARLYPVIETKLYSDGTPMIKQEFPDRVDSIVINHTSLLQFVTAMFLVDSLNERGHKIKNLILPYLPGARQDRINEQGDVLFSAKSFAKMINDRNFDRVVCIDPHSPVMPALIDRCSIYEIGMELKESGSHWSGIIAADAGGAKRAERLAGLYGLPVFYGKKHRDVSTGKLSGFSIDIPAHRHYLVVDDICDGGGTFVGLGEQIKLALSTADLYVTHGIFSKGTKALTDYYKNIYTTDSLEQDERNRVSIIPVVNKMMEMTR